MIKEPKYKIGDLVIVPVGEIDKNGVQKYMQGKIFMADINIPLRYISKWFYGVEGYHTAKIDKKERVYVFEKEIIKKLI